MSEAWPRARELANELKKHAALAANDGRHELALRLYRLAKTVDALQPKEPEPPAKD